MITKSYKNGFVLELTSYYEGLSEWYRHSEIETQDWIIDNALPSWNSIDCGSHLGYYAMLLSQLCPDGEVHAIEAHPETVLMSRINQVHNTKRFGYDFSNLHTWCHAIGDQNEKCKTKIWYTGRSKDTIGETEEIVEFITLDSFVEKMKLQPDFIKSDVDGWDYELLLGAKRIMEEQRPIIIAEINYALGWRNHTAAEVEKLLKDRNYIYQKLDAACPQNWLMIPV